MLETKLNDPTVSGRKFGHPILAELLSEDRTAPKKAGISFFRHTNLPRHSFLSLACCLYGALYVRATSYVLFNRSHEGFGIITLNILYWTS